MIVRFSCWLVLLAVYCVALADFEVSTDEIEFDNNTFVDNVPFPVDCYCGSHTKSCSYVEGKKKCICDYLYADKQGTCSFCDCLNVNDKDGCEFDDDGRKKCNCLKDYVEVDGDCLKCDCGEHGNCFFSGWYSTCQCEKGYADNYGTCEECDCGEHGNCIFFGNGRTCQCKKGYADKNGACEECDCGEHGNCTLYGWGKSCQCEKGYTDTHGTCEECDCGEHGSCYFASGIKRCFCHTGFEENHLGKCQECDCGEFSRCRFERLFGYNKICTCEEGYAFKSEVCTPCDCGENGRCTFNAGNKQCYCNNGFVENDRGKCEECDCQIADSNCTIDGAVKKCQCPKGFEPSKDYPNPVCIDTDQCLSPEDNDCDPLSTKCVNTQGSYDCVCKEGFQIIYNSLGYYDIKKDGCKDIDECLGYSPCFNLHARCVNTPGSYKCECTAGYSLEKDSLGEKYNYCSEDDRPWKTASIVVGFLFGFVSLGLLITICNKYCCIW